MKTTSFEKKEKNKCWLNIYGNVDERTDYLTRYVLYFSIVSSSMTITRFLKKNQITEKKDLSNVILFILPNQEFYKMRKS